MNSLNRLGQVKSQEDHLYRVRLNSLLFLSAVLSGSCNRAVEFQ